MESISQREKEDVRWPSAGSFACTLPSAMFENVLDVLRNEKPIYIYFGAGKALLATSLEPRR
jgi:hypothetical protein